MDIAIEVDFYQSSSGTSQVKDEIWSVPSKARAKIIKRLELLKRQGISFMTRAGYMIKLQGYGIYELKFHFNRLFYRILCVVRDGTCWLIHMFNKKSNSTPAREIATAEARIRDLDYQLAQ